MGVSATLMLPHHGRSQNRHQSSFDPVAHRTEAKRIIEIYDKEIAGKYDGGFFISLNHLVLTEIAQPLLE